MTPEGIKKPLTCEGTLDACGLAVEAQKRAIADQQEVIDNLKGRLNTEQEATKKAQERGFFENPAVLIILGVIGGAVGVSKLR